MDIFLDRLSSEQKLKQHMSIHEEGFEIKLRTKLEQVMAIDINEIDTNARELIMKKFDMKCDMCQTEFCSLNEAQSHYFSIHNNLRGYVKCCDIKLRDEGLVKEHIAYHIDPESYQSVSHIFNYTNLQFNFKEKISIFQMFCM